MDGHQEEKISPVSRSITWSCLKKELYSLNMRMLLAMQSHDEEMQRELKMQIEKLQEEMDWMGFGGRKSDMD